MENILRLIILLEIFLGLGIWCYWCLKNKSKKNYGVAPILFLINGLLFSIFAGFNLLSKELFIFWRDLVSIHGLTIIITIGIILIQLTGGKK